MPEHDGFWLLQKVREMEGGPGIPIAALTAHASAATRLEVLRAGFQLHLTKPADMDAVMDLAAGAPDQPAQTR